MSIYRLSIFSNINVCDIFSKFNLWVRKFFILMSIYRLQNFLSNVNNTLKKISFLMPNYRFRKFWFKCQLIRQDTIFLQLRESKISMDVGAQAHESSPFYYILWATFMSLSSNVHTDLRFSRLYNNKLKLKRYLHLLLLFKL